MPKELTLEQLTGCGLADATAADLLDRVNSHLRSLPAAECWQALCRRVLTSDHPFALHQLLHATVFSDWDPAQGPPPAWFPSEEQIRTSNLAAFWEALGLDSYRAFHAWSAQNRAAFWEAAIRRLDIRFRRGFSEVMDLSDGVESPRWLAGAELNIAESCFRAPEDATAIVYQEREGDAVETVSYGALRRLANRVSNGLGDAGFVRGDAVAIDMPMTAESVAIYLGIVQAGCAVVSVADSFAPHEIAMRLRLAGAKAIFTQDYILRAGRQLPLYGRVVSADAPAAVVLSCGTEAGGEAQLRDGDVVWGDFLSDEKRFDPVPCDPADATNILFSSGTTGEPKAIPWTQSAPIRCAADGHLHHNIRPGDVVVWPTNLGWMMGPWLIYAGLVNRATIGLYYDAPTDRGFGRFVQDARVNMLGLVPSLVRVWRDTGCMQGLDWSAIQAFSSTGECSNAEDMLFLMSLAGYRPVIEYCGGTEIGGAYITGTVVQPAAPATFTTPAVGVDFVILDEDGREADNGEVFLVPPSIGLSTDLLNRDHHEVYFEGTPTVDGAPLRRHGDQIERLGNGYYRAHGRVDDTMNLGGIKVSSTEIERILGAVTGIRETAAIAVPPPEGGPSRLVIYAVLMPGTEVDVEALKGDMQAAIRGELNPLFRIHDVVIVDALPRTASNKVMRRVLRDRYG